MKINRYKSSEVFDDYAVIMNRYMQKRAGATSAMVDAAIQAVRHGGKIAFDALEPSLQKQVAKGIIDSGAMSADEFASLVGKNTDELAELVGEGVELAVKTAPEALEAINESAGTVVKEGKNIMSLAAYIKKMIAEGKDPALIGRELERLKNSRAQLKAARDRAQAAAGANEETIRKLDEAILPLAEYLGDKYRYTPGSGDGVRVIDAFLKKTDDAIASQAAKITKLEKQLAESGEALADMSKKYDDAADLIVKLEQKVGTLEEQNKRLLETAMEKADLAGHYKRLYDKSLKENGPDAVETVVAKAAADAAAEESAKATSKATKAVPGASEEIVQEATKAEAKGAAKADKAVAEGEAAKAKGKPEGEPDGKPGKDSKKEKSFLQEYILKKGPTLSGAAKGLWNVGKGAIGLAGGAMGLAGSGILIFLKFGALLTMLGVGGAAIWYLFLRKNPALTKETVDNLVKAQGNALSRLSALKFVSGSEGERRTQDLIVRISAAQASTPLLYSPEGELEQQQFEKILTDLDSMEEALKSYLEDKDLIAKDLESQEGWPEALQSLEQLSVRTLELKAVVLQAYEDYKNSAGEEEGVTAPGSVGRGAPTEETSTGAPKRIRDPISIFGKEFETSHLDPGIRDSLAGMMSAVLATPAGLAYLDPKGGRGPYGRNYLEAIKYLYLRGVGSQRELIKEVENSFGRKIKDKKLRKRKNSAFRQRMQEYRADQKWSRELKQEARKYQKRTVSSKNSDFFTQKFEKPANSKTSSVIYDAGNSINMQKKADNISKQYYQDAISGLADQYAKSYYAGLKSMYDQKLGRTEADFKETYELHGETGADLIGKAHPKSIDIAESMGRGGVVENQIEQQRHNRGVAQSMPSGNFRGRHAWVIQNLVKLADEADKRGLEEASDLIDAALKELADI